MAWAFNLWLPPSKSLHRKRPTTIGNQSTTESQHPGPRNTHRPSTTESQPREAPSPPPPPPPPPPPQLGCSHHGHEGSYIHDPGLAIQDISGQFIHLSGQFLPPSHQKYVENYVRTISVSYCGLGRRSKNWLSNHICHHTAIP